MKAQLFIALVVASILSGCASSGRRMDADKLAQIKPGVTTRADLMQWFGTPIFQALDTNGKSTMNWQYTQAQSYYFYTDVKSQILSVVLAANDTVEKFSLVDNLNKPGSSDSAPAPQSPRATGAATPR